MNVSIAQILHAKKTEDNQLLLFDNNISAVVCVVGRVVSMETKGTCQLFTINDGTGSITARQWILLSTPVTSIGQIGEYVRIVGSAKPYRDAISISVQNMEVIHSFDSITLHWLEAIHTIQFYSRTDPIINLPHQQRRVIAPAPSLNVPTKPKQPVKQPEPVMDDPFWGDITLNETQQKVLHVIQQYGLSSSEGVSMQIILQNTRKMGMTDKETMYANVMRLDFQINCLPTP